MTTATITRSLTFAGAPSQRHSRAWLEQVVCHDDPELSLAGDTSEMSQTPQLRIRLSTDTVVAMSVAGTIAAVIAALLAMIVHAPPSPFVATQPPAAIEASSI